MNSSVSAVRGVSQSRGKKGEKGKNLLIAGGKNLKGVGLEGVIEKKKVTCAIRGKKRGRRGGGKPSVSGKRNFSLPEQSKKKGKKKKGGGLRNGRRKVSLSLTGMTRACAMGKGGKGGKKGKPNKGVTPLSFAKRNLLGKERKGESLPVQRETHINTKELATKLRGKGRKWVL